MFWTTRCTLWLILLNFVIIACVISMSFSIGKTQNDVYNKHTSYLRNAIKKDVVMSEDEYFEKYKRFSIVIVTFNEPMLEKTYPIDAPVVFLTTQCVEHFGEYSCETSEGNHYSR